jgi:hypothetical protein
MRYGIDDVRLTHGADLRYLSQFGQAPGTGATR